jgi:hypothetical protein
MTPTLSNIFISYRRVDTGSVVPSLAAALIQTFGAAAVFLDTDTIRLGRPWPQQIDRALEAAEILLIAMGPNWLNVTDENGQRRLDQEMDWVRNEIANSIRRNIQIIPLLIGGAVRPSSDELPGDLSTLPNYPEFELRNEHWQRDISALIDHLVKNGCKRLSVAQPKIILMDSYAKVYERKPVSGEMNSHVIERRLQGLLPPDTIDIEPVYRDWQGGDGISRKKPDLIIIHYSCMDDDRGQPRRLKQFLEKVLSTSENTKIIVYSRTSSEPSARAASAFARRIRDLVPWVKGRVYGLPIYRRKTHPQTFSDPETASALRSLVKEVLKIDD